MRIEPFFDPATFTLTYVVSDEATGDAVIIDPVLDYDPLKAETSTTSLMRLVDWITEQQLRVRFILETHAHADHISGSQFLRRRFDAPVAIGARITEVQATFKDLFDLSSEFPIDGRQFDRLLKDGEVLQAGALAIHVLATPGHTPACVSYLIGDAIFTGDTLFLEDVGTGRCDFPRGSAADLYDSVSQRLYTLPDTTRVFPGHDYPNEREVRHQTTIAASKANNIQLRGDTTRQDYVAMRTGRDRTLVPPRLLFPSVQVNIDAGHLPRPHANGRRYLSWPLNLFHPSDDDGSRDNPKPKETR